MRTSDLMEASPALGMFASEAGVPPGGQMAMPSVELSMYSQLIQHMASMYRCDPAAVAASLASLGTSHLPLALTAPRVLNQSAALTNGANSLDYHVQGSLISPQKLEDTAMNEEEQSPSKSPPQKKYQMSYQHSHEKTKRIRCNKNNLMLTHDSNGALDLSTQGLKSLYSNYRRISFDSLKPKTVDDIWVENDISLSWTESKVAAYNPVQKLFMCVDCECVGFLSRVAEHWLGAHANLRVFRCPKCPYTSAWSRCVKMHLTRQHNEQCADTTMWKENATLMEVTKLMQDLRTKVETRIDSTSTLADKRFYCPHCPYATDRRDLYTRHENIHKDDKPFHCYLCFKQFNRADHVKKHFVRMHPDTPYDIAKIRKQPAVRGRNSPTDSAAAPSSSTIKQSLPALTAAVTELASSPPLSSIHPYSLSPINCKRSPSPLPLTVQNLRVHNLHMSKQYPVPPPSPDINVDVVNLDPQIEITPIKPHVSSEINVDTLLTKDSFKPHHLSLNMKNTTNTFNFTDNSNDCKSSEAVERVSPKSSSQSPSGKKRVVKSFLCPYCHWSGSDNWCLKRHMNTHIKPFACTMCEYKAARAERLSTHVLKVHNKRICNKCNFICESQENLLEHVRHEHHNNPYSRRHTCGICGMTLENQSALQYHLTSVHAPPLQTDTIPSNQPPTSSVSESAKSGETDPAQISCRELSSANCSFSSEVESGSFVFMCPVEECSDKYSDAVTLAKHLEMVHSSEGITRCPHCGVSLAINDDRSKDHWLLHHKEVCAVCVYVFTAIYGAQLWKKVHARYSSTTSGVLNNNAAALDLIVNGLGGRKRSAPDDDHSDCELSENMSVDSEAQDSDPERQSSKRQRKQSCPKRVINLKSESDGDQMSKQEADDAKKDVKLHKCLRCPNVPTFSNYSRLRIHNRNKHRSIKKSGTDFTKAVMMQP